ncbi:MAG: acetyl-CoA carboxylase biotin carboxyl carrier protein [Acidobacteriota bacterium]|nr:acetyl-CoA carboxylase biotin carboxyl carrier protein [Acidobacteriota bacterium]
MTLDEIKQLIDFIRDRELSEFELERADFKLRIKSGVSAQAVAVSAPSPPVSAPVPATATPAAAEDVLSAAGEELAMVTSPIVGTFYRAAEPGAKALVEVGDIVRKGQVLCIIEAMKLMNEIDSECDGEVVSIYVQNGQAVQYGERLFAIRLQS